MTSICWNCKFAIGGCSWADNLELVKGCKTKKEGGGFTVIKCPKFSDDSRIHVSSEEVAKMLGVSPRTYFRHIDELKGKVKYIDKELVFDEDSRKWYRVKR